MKFSDRLKGLANQFHVVSPFSDMAREDIANCQRLSEITGLSWEPVNVGKPIDTGVPSQFHAPRKGRYVDYHCHTDSWVQADRISGVLKEELGGRACTPSHPGWGNYVYLSQEQFDGFRDKLQVLDPELLQSRLREAIIAANKYDAGEKVVQARVAAQEAGLT